MFSFINRDRVVGVIFGVVLIGAVFFMTGCADEACEDTSDTAAECTTTTGTGTTSTGTGTTGTGTGTTTGT